MDEQAVPADLFATGIQIAGAPTGSKVGGGRYRLVRILGRGGMGVVWLAHDERLGSDVALKFLPAQIRHDKTALDDLRRETARSRKLTHPNIIRIHDLYEAPGEEAFISMEYIDGRNLADLRVQEAARVFTWQHLKPLIEQLCAGLEYAHAERIIHRDLKPANIMIDGKGRLKLADFGIARTVSDTMSRNSVSQTGGTILYMSPQQMEGEPPRPTDDIYALGATLYELLTGKPPFFTGNVVHQVRNVPPRPMQERLRELDFANDIPAEVERVIFTCLSKDAQHRPQTAAEVWRQLVGGNLKLRAAQPGGTSSASVPANTPRRWLWLAAGAVACAIIVASIEAGSNRTPVTARESAALPTAAKSNVTSVAKIEPPVTTNAAPREVIAPSVVDTATLVSSNPPLPEARKAVEKPVELARNVPAPIVEIPLVSKAEAPTPSLETNDVPTLSRATALQLLEKGNSYVSARSKNRILQLASSRAPIEHPPQSWRILYLDDKTTYNAVEVQFKAGEMERVFEPNRILNIFTPSSSKTLDLAKIKVDSDQAIRIAAAQCTEEFVVVKFTEMKLERGYGGLPVWNVKLFGLSPGKAAEDAALGSVIVLAEDGKVLKTDLATRGDKPLPKK